MPSVPVLVIGPPVSVESVATLVTPPAPQAPASIRFPFKSHFAQSFVVRVPVVVTNLLVFPDMVPEVKGDGRREVLRVPLDIFEAFVVSVVADEAKLTPLVFVHVMAPVV